MRPMKRSYSTVNAGGSLEEGSPDIALGEILDVSEHFLAGERGG